MDVTEFGRCVPLPDLGENSLGCLFVLEDQSRMITKFSEVLQRLEDMLLLATFIRTNDVFSCGTCLRLREVIIKLLLQFGQLAIVILYDLWR